jgi:hypothetical protein
MSRPSSYFICGSKSGKSHVVQQIIERLDQEKNSGSKTRWHTIQTLDGIRKIQARPGDVFFVDDATTDDSGLPELYQNGRN